MIDQIGKIYGDSCEALEFQNKEINDAIQASSDAFSFNKQSIKTLSNPDYIGAKARATAAADKIVNSNTFFSPVLVGAGTNVTPENLAEFNTKFSEQRTAVDDRGR